jgi:hypothetical protein
MEVKEITEIPKVKAVPFAFYDRAKGGFYSSEASIPEKDKVPGRFKALYESEIDPFSTTK